MKILPFDIVKGKDDSILIEMEVNKGEKTQVTPEKISTYVLQEAKDIAESYFDDGTKIEKCVITVPAYFNSFQRKATEKSAKAAGLTVLKIINEPTAAAINYGKEQGFAADKNIMIFDLGGGTFDVTILRTNNKGTFDVLATQGDMHLGGEDFNAYLIDFMIEKLKEEYDPDDVNQTVKKPNNLRKVRNAVETAKKELTYAAGAALQFESGDLELNFMLNQAKFDQIVAPLIPRIIKVVQNSLKDSKLQKNQIDEVILVGGSSRIPIVQRKVKEFFGGKELNTNIDFDYSVAMGATIHAYKIASKGGDLYFTQGDSEYQDITPQNLGIEVAGGKMHTILPRGHPYNGPGKEQSFKTCDDNQHWIHVTVYEGDADFVDGCKKLGKVTVDNLPQRPAGQSAIIVKLTADGNGIITVTAYDQDNPSNKSELKIEGNEND